MKKISLIIAFLAVFLSQGCDDIMNALSPKTELEIRASGVCNSDENTYKIDGSYIYDVHVSFTGFSNATGTHYRPRVVIKNDGGELKTFFGDNEINGHHDETYSVSSANIEVYAELCQDQDPVYEDTCRIELTEISVY